MRPKANQPDYDSLRAESLAVGHRVKADYEALKPSKQVRETETSITGKTSAKILPLGDSKTSAVRLITKEPKVNVAQDQVGTNLRLKRGHSLSYVGLWLFTVALYTRPAEFYPSPVTSSIALILGLITIGLFIPTQLSLEGKLTAPLREVNLVLLFGLLGLLSIPLAISPADAWHEFSGTFIRCIVIFLVMVNVVRTHARLNALLFLTLAVSIWLSLGAVNDYRLGLMTVEGYRVDGRGDGIFGNTNDMALHLVTIFPIAIALCFATRHRVRKMFYGTAALLILIAVVLTYSRGGFLGLLVASAFLAWKVGHRQRVLIALIGFVLLVLLLLLAPGNYAARLASIFVPSLDPVGSAGMRREILLRSIFTAIRHPLLGIGMGNFHNVSIRELVSHNAFTQVAAEMGMLALVTYTMFILTPLRKLGQVARETLGSPDSSRYYYLAIGLQASLLGYIVSSNFASVAYTWYVYYLVGYAVCLRRLYEAETGKAVVLKGRQERKTEVATDPALVNQPRSATI